LSWVRRGGFGHLHAIRFSPISRVEIISDHKISGWLTMKKLNVFSIPYVRPGWSQSFLRGCGKLVEIRGKIVSNEKLHFSTPIRRNCDLEILKIQFFQSHSVFQSFEKPFLPEVTPFMFQDRFRRIPRRTHR